MNRYLILHPSPVLTTDLVDDFGDYYKLIQSTSFLNKSLKFKNSISVSLPKL
jgi:hypothetical protein